jgi:hypothetical protein
MKALLNFRRPIIFVAAIGNMIASLIAILSPSFFLSQLFKYPPDPGSTFPYLSMYHYTFWGFVLIMGIAYWMCGVNTEKHRIVLFIGGAGKLVAAAFWIMLFFQEQGGWLMIAGGGWDGLLGIVFLFYFLSNTAKKEVSRGEEMVELEEKVIGQ